MLQDRIHQLLMFVPQALQVHIACVINEHGCVIVLLVLALRRDVLDVVGGALNHVLYCHDVLAKSARTGFTTVTLDLMVCWLLWEETPLLYLWVSIDITILPRLESTRLHYILSICLLQRLSRHFGGLCLSPWQHESIGCLSILVLQLLHPVTVSKSVQGVLTATTCR